MINFLSLILINQVELKAILKLISIAFILIISSY